MEKALKHTSPHVPNHLVSGEGGPKAAEPHRATPTTPETATFEDFQRDEESPAAATDEKTPSAATNDENKPAITDDEKKPSVTTDDGKKPSYNDGETEPLVEPSGDPPLPEE